MTEADTDEAFEHYLSVGGEKVAFGFIDALQSAYKFIAANPELGSPRYAHELGLAGLRHRRLPSYPYLIFYVVNAQSIDVWRILHAERDIPAWLGEPDADL